MTPAPVGRPLDRTPAGGATGPGTSIAHPALAAGGWQEVLDTDALEYGGSGEGNAGATLRAAGGVLHLVVPAGGVVVFRRVP